MKNLLRKHKGLSTTMWWSDMLLTERDMPLAGRDMLLTERDILPDGKAICP